MFAGLFAGLYVDIMYGRYLGVYSLLFMLFAAFVSVISFEQVKLKTIWSLSIAIPSFLIYTMVESFTAKLIALARTGGTVLYENYGVHMLKRILPVTLYDVIIFFILFVPIRLIWDKLGPKYEIF
jgi:rod shape-determining protein MreD